MIQLFNYIFGEIKEQGNNNVVVENNNIGFTVFVANPFSYDINKSYKIYLYNNIREDEYSLYGFKSVEEKEMFLKLINVKGLGPKMAMPILATGSINGLIDAIERENILYLTKFPKIGEKLARQIILDLKGKLTISSKENINDNSSDLVEVLTSLGYKTAEIKKALLEVNTTKSLEEQVKEALKMMLK